MKVKKVFKTLIGEWVWGYENWCAYIFNIMKKKKKTEIKYGCSWNVKPR